MRRLLVLVVLAGVGAGCLAVPASPPRTTEVAYLVAGTPAAALDSVAAWAAGSDFLALDRTDGLLVVRDRRPGQTNTASVEAQPYAQALTRVTVRSRYVMAPSFRDLGLTIYSGQRGQRGAAFALPRPGSPSCFSIEDWVDTQTDDREKTPAETPSADLEAEVSPELIGGLPGLQRRLVYPATMRRAGIEGAVLVQFVVGETGVVECAEVVSSPHPDFTASALEAVLASTFTPGTQGGVPVQVRFAVPLTFALR
ncbi:energy transducer TonB [Rubrivirga sp. IMCC43871]|uniref:energy transducer TonB n=1 Tax=Rubrivirga sp. IMCC43871 TaxID=3391575 RepID=UPI00398FC9E6